MVRSHDGTHNEEPSFTHRAARLRLTQLPYLKFGSDQSFQAGYYSYASHGGRQHGTPFVVATLQEAAKKLSKKNIVMGIGDLSFASGGEMKPHKSHRRGLSVDLRMISESGVAQQGTYSSPGYSQDKTFEMLQAIIDTNPQSIRMIIINSTSLAALVKQHIRENYPGVNIKIGPGKGHDNHIHIDWKII